MKQHFTVVSWYDKAMIVLAIAGASFYLKQEVGLVIRFGLRYVLPPHIDFGWWKIGFSPFSEENKSNLKMIVTRNSKLASTVAVYHQTVPKPQEQ